MKANKVDYFFEKTYSSFPIVDNASVMISENIEKEKWSEYSSRHKIAYITDAFFSHTELDIQRSKPKCLSLDLDPQHLALISPKLPEYLTLLSKNQQLSVAEKVVKATEYINLTYGNEQGWIWKTKKVNWDLTHLPFFLHLWSNPHLTEQAMVFGLARAHCLHSSMNLGPQGLEAMQAACKRDDFFKLVSFVVELVSFFFLPHTPRYISHNWRELDNRKIITILDENHEKKLDLEALKLTSNSEAALHYLRSIQADFDSRTSSRWNFLFFSNSKPKSTNRIAELEFILKQNEEKSYGQKFKEYTLAPILFFWRAIMIFFKKFGEFLTIPFHWLKSSI